MYHVLLAVDDDEERALAEARTVTDLPVDHESIRATLVHVFTDNPSGASASQVKAVRQVEDHLSEAGIDAEVREYSGDPGSVVLEAAEDLDVDLVVLAGRKRSPTGKVVFGSVTQKVLLGTHRPVLVCDVHTDGEEE